MLTEIIKYGILIVLVAIYCIYTIRYIRELKSSLLLDKRLKILHGILIWLIPFLWILLLKSISKTAPGSYQIKKKEEGVPFSGPYDSGM